MSIFVLRDIFLHVDQRSEDRSRSSENLLLEFQQMDARSIAKIHHLLQSNDKHLNSTHFPVLNHLLQQAASSLTRSSKAELLARRVKDLNTEKRSGKNNFNIWDIPRTEVWKDWTRPPGDLGSELFKKNKLGITEYKKIEALEVVNLARQQLPFSFSSSSTEQPARVTRFDRTVNRGKGVQYSVQFHRVNTDDPPQWTSVHLSRPFQQLKVETIKTSNNIQMYVVVAVKNRTPQLKKLMFGLQKMSNHITLVVVDHASTDENVRRVVERESSLQLTQYLFAPRRIAQFSRAAMLDYGIRYCHQIDPNSIFFSVDVDMELPENLPAMVWGSTEKGKAVYAPIVRTMDKHGKSSFFDWGYGMLGAYAADYVRVGGFDLEKFLYGWGGEDIELVTKFVQEGMSVVRPTEKEMLHRYHEKLEWRSKSGCKFSWRGGEFCSSKHDGDDDNDNDNEEQKEEENVNEEGDANSGASSKDGRNRNKRKGDAGRRWSLQLSTGKHCDSSTNPQHPRTTKHAFDIDVPAGKYLVVMSSTTGGWSVDGNDVPPTVALHLNQGMGRGMTTTTTTTTPLMMTLEQLHQGVVVETKETSTLWMWHVMMTSNNADSSMECSDRRGATTMVVTEIMSSSTELSQQLLRLDGARHCVDERIKSSDILSSAPAPVHLPPGAYLIKAESGGFDAGDGILYFRAELSLVILDSKLEAKTLSFKTLGQTFRLEVKGEKGGYLFGVVKDKMCADNSGTLVLKVTPSSSSSKEESSEELIQSGKIKVHSMHTKALSPKSANKRKKHHDARLVEV